MADLWLQLHCEPIIFLADDSNLVLALHDEHIEVSSSFEVQPFNNVSYNNKNNITSVIPQVGSGEDRVLPDEEAGKVPAACVVLNQNAKEGLCE
ncbi:hypothetical protein KY284_007107 [Solanum tuberosum]|nr:hypothetical protein KY284_007107 [Solanum tuberosum]